MTRGGKRKGAGRKPSSEGPAVVLAVRVSEGRLAAYREAAARRGLTLAAWVTVACDKAARWWFEVEPTAIRVEPNEAGK